MEREACRERKLLKIRRRETYVTPPPSNLSWFQLRVCRNGTMGGTKQRPSQTQFLRSKQIDLKDLRGREGGADSGRREEEEDGGPAERVLHE